MKYLLQKKMQIYKLLKLNRDGRYYLVAHIKAENENDAIHQAKLKTKSQSISCL